MIPALVAAAGSLTARAGVDHADLPSWKRTNFTGDPVSLTGGIDVLAGLLAGSAVSGTHGLAPAIAAVSAAVGGYVDDHLEDRFPATGKGFQGHLGALRQGRVTTGILKIASTGTGALLAAGVIARTRRADDYYLAAGQTVLDAAIISLSANLLNLLDLRPGRARKAALALAVIPAASGSVAALVALGAAAAGMPADLGGRTMLGDLGANALGAYLGVALAACPVTIKAGVLAALITLNAASERISFSEVIERTPGLRELDLLGQSS